MYAIVEIGGQQFEVEKGREIFVHRLADKEGSRVEFDKVLLLEKGAEVLVGKPVIQKAKIVAQVLSHQKGDKVTIFKKKKRKGYKVTRGHRQYFTRIRIEEIQG